MGFYDQVKSLAKINKVTIEFVVGKAGLSLGSYNAYRRRENLPRADEALKIAQALGTTVEYLVTGEDGLSAGERELLAAYNRLNEAGKQAAIGAVGGLYAAFPLPAGAGTAKTAG